jgi:NAD+ kinase
VATEPEFHRVTVVVHPSRPVDAAVAALTRWTEERGVELLELAKHGESQRRIAAAAEVEPGDLVIALGGDGTVLKALRSAATVGTPVLGVACGSLGALSAISADEIAQALDRVWSGDWTPRSLPALAIAAAGAADDWALNDFVIVRRGAGPVAATVAVDDEPYVRIAGDGLIVATAQGSSAYSMAAGGPLLVLSAESVVVTPLVIHGGSIPPIVVPPSCSVVLDLIPGFGGFDVEIDGQTAELTGTRFELRLEPAKATLVAVGDPGLGLTPLRRRGLIADSPRVVARDERARKAGA